MLTRSLARSIFIIFKFRRNFHQETDAHAMNDPNALRPPEHVRGMQKLDKNQFHKVIQVPIVKLQSDQVSGAMKTLKKYLLKLENFRPVQQQQLQNGGESENTEKITEIHLDPIKYRNFLHDDPEINKFVIEWKPLNLTFDNYTLEDIMRAVLPSDAEGLASFTKVGHIVHVNLRDHLFPFKPFIGQVLLEKIAHARTVVNKLDTIDSTYRNFKMEVLAGEEDFIVSVKENKCTFDFDYSAVYWNSRLCTEHERIVAMIRPGDVLFDVFAGVGPFAIPAARNGAQVWANDLNPESFKWLQVNARKNKVGERMHLFNKDGGDFICNEVKVNLLKALQDGRRVHVAMNLPALATTFLKHFVGLYDSSDDLQNVEEINACIYLYCFAKGEDSEAITRDLLSHCCQVDLSEFIRDLHRVRTVSNFKEMMRVTIDLKRNFLLNDNLKINVRNDSNDNKTGKRCQDQIDNDDGTQTETKKQCIS